MAKGTTKTVEWNEVIDVAAEASGAPKKQLAEDAEIISKAIKTVLTNKQPKRDGDELMVETPFALYKSTRIGETVVKDAQGNSVTRPACCAVNVGIEHTYIDAANIGLVDKESVAKGTTKTA